MDNATLERATDKLGHALRLARERRGLIQEEVATHLEISQAFLSQIESGKRQPTFGLLCKMSKLYEVSLTQIMNNANL